MSYPTYIPSIGTRLADLIDDQVCINRATVRKDSCSRAAAYEALINSVRRMEGGLIEKGATEQVKNDLIDVAAAAIVLYKELF